MKRDANPEKGLEALDQCEYMVLAMTDGEGKPYCIPLNGVRVGEKIYFHCAKAGEKVDCLRTHPQVCLTAVGHQRVIRPSMRQSTSAQWYAAPPERSQTRRRCGRPSGLSAASTARTAWSGWNR